MLSCDGELKADEDWMTVLTSTGCWQLLQIMLIKELHCGTEMANLCAMILTKLFYLMIIMVVCLLRIIG